MQQRKPSMVKVETIKLDTFPPIFKSTYLLCFSSAEQIKAVLKKNSPRIQEVIQNENFDNFSGTWYRHVMILIFGNLKSAWRFSNNNSLLDVFIHFRESFS